jgi:hypothetical protein
MQIHTIRWASGLALALALALGGCASSQPPPQSPPSGEPKSASERTEVTAKDCEAQGGTVTGDIGDGATQRADYVCASGKRPLGTIAAPAGGAMAVEGAVCCPR